MNDEAQQSEPTDGNEPEARARRPYVAPRIESGEAFERVQLASGCNEGIFDCEVPC